MGRIATHYEILGVSPEAPAAVIRDAYRRAARVHHPDAAGSAAGVASVHMVALNEAWRVLGDPVRRARYDAELARSTPPSPSSGSRVAGGLDDIGSRPTAPPAGPEPRYPWRFVGGMALVGVAIVAAGVVVYDSSEEPAAPDNLLRAGSCVVVEPNGDAREVSCESSHDGVVNELVPFGSPCPDRTEPHRDRQGLGTACVRMGEVAAP